jgi:ATP-dependent Clp protease adaptor protein ClpS
MRVRLVKKKAGRPRRYKVLLINDPLAPPGIVLRLLRAVFRKSDSEGFKVMAEARRTGAGIVAVYTQEVAEMKVQIAAQLATQYRQPVSFRTEPAD